MDDFGTPWTIEEMEAMDRAVEQFWAFLASLRLGFNVWAVLVFVATWGFNNLFAKRPEKYDIRTAVILSIDWIFVWTMLRREDIAFVPFAMFLLALGLVLLCGRSPWIGASFARCRDAIERWNQDRIVD